MATDRRDQMSKYERRAWEESTGRLNRERNSRMPPLVHRAAERTKQRAQQAWDHAPGHAALEDQVRRALEGLISVTLKPAMTSVSLDRVCRRIGVASPRDMRELDLERLDTSLPRTRGAYTVAALLKGSASAVAVTGAEVSATVTGGVTAGVAAAAIAADTAASLAMMGRIVGRVAAQYGYDVRLPEEEAFALGVISVGTAATPAAKVAALSSLSRLTQQMMRQATWAQLNKHAPVRLIELVCTALGVRLVKRRLSQAVPVLGVLLNGGMSAHMADSTFGAARDVYRLRFLSEKYGLDPLAWVTAPEPTVDDDVLGAALAALDGGHPNVAG